MTNRNTRQIRIITDGKFDLLMQKIEKQFKEKHGFSPSSKELCEAIAKAIMDANLF